MKRFARFDVLYFLAVLAALAVPPIAQAGPPAPPVPAEIVVPEGHKPFLVAHAVGVQIYRCDVVSPSYRWNLVAPRADLYADNGKLVATHFGGPTWLARDGSRVVGQVDKRATVDPSAIQWLRLSATSATAGADGARLAGTTFIQRIKTTGGLAPAPTECNASAVGETAEIPYTADYVFWKATGQRSIDNEGANS